MTTSGNAYCAVLGIRAPRVEDAKSSPDANYYSLLLVALLERGEPMTLEEAAARLAAAGVAETLADALASLRRCQPARAPIYRDGDHYALDPHDDEVSFWLFRLGLRPPRVAPLKVVRSALDPLPSPDHQLTVANLNEAWHDGVPNTWSAQRVAVVVLDAHGTAMSPAEVFGVCWRAQPVDALARRVGAVLAQRQRRSRARRWAMGTRSRTLRGPIGA